jgi:hypothetical protein
MTRGVRVPAIALILSSVMAMTGSVPHDAMAGIVALSQPAGASVFQEEGPAEVRSGADVAPHPHRDVAARYWMRGIVLVLILLLILWLIYRTFTGWKPMIA